MRLLPDLIGDKVQIRLFRSDGTTTLRDGQIVAIDRPWFRRPVYHVLDFLTGTVFKSHYVLSRMP